jgi:iron(III) transport system permease protein
MLASLLPDRFLTRRTGLPPGHGWSLLQMSLCVLITVPMLFIALAALGDNQGLLGHLLETVLLRYLGNTLLLMFGVGVIATLFGVSTAWLVSRYDFPGRGLLSWMLVLPLAMPAYLIAYTYTDFLEYAGPVQTMLRALFGWQTARDYWFPEVRSAGGAILMMGSVLYPYVYILSRTAFAQTSRRLFEAASLSGKSLFGSVGLPLARPAVIAGLSLVLMEVVSDFGTVDYFALETLTLGIFNVWLGMNNMPAAAQIALFAFVLILILLLTENYARARRAYGEQGASAFGVPRITAPPGFAFICILVCVLPVFFGFFLPVLRLVKLWLDTAGPSIATDWLLAAGHTFEAAFAAALAVSFTSLIIGVVSRYQQGQAGRILAAVSATGYAFPGTILAIGVLYFASLTDRAWIEFGQLIGRPRSLPLLGGTLAVLIIAYMVRFQAVGYGAIKDGLGRMPPDMMQASRSLGKNFSRSVWGVILPLLRPSILAAGLLVFVDVMKELPLTLLLRPFDFETFATVTYQYAKDEMLEKAALPALLIVLSGLIPVVIANRTLTRLGTRRL